MPLTATIQYSDRHPDDPLFSGWTDDADLELDSLALKIAPGISAAQIRRHYGYIADSGQRSARAALSLHGKFILATVTDGANIKRWYGYIPDGTDALGGTHPHPDDPTQPEVPSGLSTYTAYGMEYFLRQYTIDSSYIEDPANPGELITINRAVPFNAATSARNNRLAGNRSAATVGGLYVFDSSDTAATWTASDVVQYILYYLSAATEQTTDQQDGINLALSGQVSALDNIVDVWDLEGLTLASALDRVIPAEQGLAWYVDNGTLYVVSSSDTQITDPADPATVLLPANANIESLDLATDEDIIEPVITHIDAAHFDKIRVIGEPMRCCFTMSDFASTAAKGWTAADETNYAAATDAARRADQYDHVYCRFIIPTDWDRKDLAGLVQVPAYDPATRAPDWTTPQTMWLSDLTLDRDLPLQDDNKQPRRPLVFVIDSDTGAVHNIDKSDDLHTGAALRMLDDRPGYELSPKFAHYFGLNHFTAASENDPVMDWTNIFATVSLYTDDRIYVEVDGITPEPGVLTQTKKIEIPGAHLWVIADGTILDHDGTNFTNQSGNAVLRDDTPALRRIAAMASSWYGRERNAIAVTYGVPAILDKLGHVIKEAYTGGSVTTSGTIITAVTYDIRRQTSSLNSDWQDINFRAITRNLPTQRQQTRRLSRVQDNLTNLPVRVPAGAAPGGGGGVLVKITNVHPDSPASGVRIFQGDVYGDGSTAPATEQDVTIRIAGIAADVTTYPTGFLLAATTDQEWTGASIDPATGTNTVYSETVYEVTPTDYLTSPVKIVAGTGDTYTIDVYQNGTGSPATITGATLKVYGLEDTTLPVGLELEATNYGSEWGVTLDLWL